MYDPNENRFGDPADQFTRPPRRAGSPMAMAATACAIIAILTVFSVIGALIFGALAVIFALLSRNSRLKFERPARYALRVGILALVISAAITAYGCYNIIRQFGSFQNYYEKYLYTLEQSYGLDLTPEDGTGAGSDVGSDVGLEGAGELL